MKAKHLLYISALAAVPFLQSCNGNDDDPLADLEIIVSFYDGDILTYVTGNSATVKSDRHIDLGLSNYTGEITKVEVTRVIDGVSVVCELTTNDGDVRYSYTDWPASDTEYSLTVHTSSDSRSFGPFSFTVESANEVVNGSVSMGDQDYDVNGYGPFFQSRHVGWGGGWIYANWTSILADDNPRLLDFAILSVGSQLKAVSPDDIASIYSFTRLVNDCGHLSTLFGVYTGPIDPEVSDLSLTDIAGLPTPTETSINISEDTRFVYQTGDGKKGLIKVTDIINTGSGIRFNTFYGSEQ